MANQRKNELMKDISYMTYILKYHDNSQSKQEEYILLLKPNERTNGGAPALVLVKTVDELKNDKFELNDDNILHLSENDSLIDIDYGLSNIMKIHGYSINGISKTWIFACPSDVDKVKYTFISLLVTENSFFRKI